MPSIVRHAFAPWALCALIVPPAASVADTVETQVLHTNVYQVSGSILCVDGSACQLVFPVTDHIQTVIQSVSCTVGTLSTATLNYAILYYAGYDGFGNDQPELSLPTFYVQSSNNRDSLGINIPTTFFIPKGHPPIIEMNTNGRGGNYLAMHCTLSGYHS